MATKQSNNILSDEFTLIKKISAKIGRPNKDLRIGVGDDTAVFLPPQGQLLTTVDCLVENVHFSLEFFSPQEVGYKALAVNLSDIAAMGGKPLYALISLGIRKGLSDKFILDFYEGVMALAKKFQVQVVGGNITRADQFFADITLIGEAKEPLLRSGALVGDLIGVTGPLGLASSGLQALLRKAPEKNYVSLMKRQRRPLPRIEAGLAFGKCSHVHGLIDISDGFSSELWHLAKASDVTLEIDPKKLEISKELKDFCKKYKFQAEDFIWNGGEDYELLVTFDPQAQKSLKKFVHVVGRVSRKQAGVFARVGNRLEPIVPAGWNHLSSGE